MLVGFTVSSVQLLAVKLVIVLITALIANKVSLYLLKTQELASLNAKKEKFNTKLLEAASSLVLDFLKVKSISVF